MNDLNETKEKVLSKVLAFVGYSARTQREIDTKLRTLLSKLNLSEQDTVEITNFINESLTALRLIDDEAYANAFVDGKLRSKTNTGPSKLRAFLIKKGVNQKIIDKALERYPAENQREALEKLFNKKTRGMQTISYKDRSKLYSYFLSKGFSSELISEVLNQPTHD